MLEAKWRIDEEEGRGWKYKMGSDLFANQKKSAKTEKLKSKLTEFLQDGRTNSEVYKFGLHQGYLPTHLTSLLKEFESKGKLYKRLQNGKAARKNAFYVNYRNYKKSPSKIKMKLRG
jgi:hypothetical protein